MSALEQTPSPEPNGGLPASVPETVAGADSPLSPAPAANESLRETIERVAKSKPRDERGKFAPNVPRETSAPLTNSSQSLTTSAAKLDTAPERPKRPEAFSPELEEAWNAAHPALLQKFVQREQETEKGVAPLKERARVADEFLNAVKPYEQMIRGEGKTPIVAFQEYLNTAQVLRDPAQRVPAIASLMQQFQVSIEDLQAALAGTGSPQSNLNPQYVSQLVKQELTSYQQQQSEQQTLTEIEKFAADPAHKHYEAVVDWIPGILGSEKFIAEHSGKSAQDKLTAAYDLAVRMDPEVWAKIQSEQQAASRATEQVTQAKNAAVLVKGAPHAGPATKIDPSDRRAYISNLVKTRR